MSCEFTDVLAPNGNASILYRDILNIVRSPSRAMNIYLSTKVHGPLNFRVDENGEPKVSEIINVIEGFTDTERKTFYNVRPDILYSLDAESNLVHEQEEVLKRIDHVLSALRSKRSTVDTSDERAWYTARIDELRDGRERIAEENNFAAVQAVAQVQLSWVRRVMKQPFPRAEEMRLANEIVKAWSWDSLKHALSPEEHGEDYMWNEVFRGIADVSAPLEIQLHDKMIDWIHREIKRRSPDLEVTKEELRRSKDIGYHKLTFFDLSRVNNKLAKHIDAMLKSAARNQAGHLEEFSSKIINLSKGVDTTNLLQTDDEGNLTGNLITLYSSSYIEKRTSADKRRYTLQFAAKDKASKKARTSINWNIRHYYRDRRKLDEAIDIRFFVNDDHFTADHDSKEDYVAYLEEEYGEDQAEVLISRAEKAYEHYLQERLAAKQRFEHDAAWGGAIRQEIDGEVEGRQEYVDRSLREWEDKNSPERYIEEYYAHSADYKNEDGFRWTIHVARRHDANGKATGFYDDAYTRLSNKERELLDFINESTQEFLSYLPDHLTKDTGVGFLPKVQKSLVEHIFGGDSWVDLSGAGEKFNRKLINAITDPTIQQLNRQEDDIRRNVDPLGEDIQSIPIRFINENIDIEDRSFDVVKAMEMFASMAINFRHMNEVEDRVRLAQRIVGEMRGIREQGGNAVHDSDGNLVEMRDGVPRLKKAIDYAIEGMMYGKQRLEAEGVTDTTLYSANPFKNHKASARARRIERQRDELEDQYNNGEFTDSFYREMKERLRQQKEDEVISEEDHAKQLNELEASYALGEMSEDFYETMMAYLEAEYSELGGRNLSIGRLMESVLAYTQMKGMGWNLTAGIANLGFGLTSNIVHAGSEQDFNTNELMAATGIMLKARTKPDAKAAHVLRRLNMLFEVTEIGYGKNAERHRYRMLKWTYPFEIQRRTEFFLQGSSVIAQMLHQKLTDVNGNERTLWEAYNEDGTWNTEEFGENPEWDDKSLIGDEVNEFTKFRDKALQVNKMLHGNYDPNSLVHAKKYVIWRSLLMFKSWVAEGFLWRFGKEDYDQQLGRVVKGRWLSIRDVGREAGWSAIPKTLFNVLIKKKDLTVNGRELSDLDIANMKANVMEMKFWLGLMGAIVMLKMALGDDDDENAAVWTGRVLLAQLYRIESDMRFYMSPNTIMEIVDNPMPALKTFGDFQHAVDATWSYVYDEDYEGLEPWWRWSRAFPATGQIYKTWWMATHDTNWAF